jgi:ATP-dependent RNA helicase RhlE
MTTFHDLGLIRPLTRAVDRLGYDTPTPIQAQAIGPLLAGRDVLGCAQTGTGKTAAFALPILQRIAGSHGVRPHGGRGEIRSLVLTPTRELAAQIAASFERYGRFVDVRHAVIYGGVSERPQIAALRRGVDCLIATPGRLLDLAGRGLVRLDAVELFVLDEADRMLDMGFIRDVRRIIERLPRQRQNLLFSATLPAPIVDLTRSLLHDPVRIEVAPQPTAGLAIDEQVMFVDGADKRQVLIDLLGDAAVERSIVFTRTKRRANRLARQLENAGIRSAAIHGNKSQGARNRALADFRSGAVDVLVATDIASRGIDVADITHVFNFDLPAEPESYVHRIGRTGRAGQSGIAISLCDTGERAALRSIERITGAPIAVVAGHELSREAPPAAAARPGRGSGRPRRRGRSPRGRRALG